MDGAALHAGLEPALDELAVGLDAGDGGAGAPAGAARRQGRTDGLVVGDGGAGGRNAPLSSP